MSEQKPNEDQELETGTGQELAVPKPANLKTIEQENAEKIKLMEGRFELYNRMVKLALSRTRPGDWVDIGGKPYLQATGAKKLLKPFGISISAPLFEKIEKPSGKRGEPEVIWECVIAAWDRQSEPFTEIGAASSADDFFAKRKNRDTGEEYYLPLAEIDLEDVKKKSLANALGRAIKGFIGLDNLTWEDLAASGITRAEKGYDFKKGGQGGGSTTDEGAAKKRIEIREMLLEALNGDKDAAQEALKQLTMYNGRGLSSVDQISDKAVNINHQKVKAFCEAFHKDPDMAAAVKAGRDAVEKK